MRQMSLFNDCSDWLTNKGRILFCEHCDYSYFLKVSEKLNGAAPWYELAAMLKRKSVSGCQSQESR